MLLFQPLAGPLTWANAPGNDPNDPASLMKPADLLVETQLGPSNPGDLLVFKNADSVSTNGLLAFLRPEQDGLATFIVTVEPPEPAEGEEGREASTWGFASRSHPELLPPIAILVIRAE